VVLCACHPTYTGSVNRSIPIQPGLHINSETIFKKQKELRVWFKWQSKYKALSSNPITAKSKREHGLVMFGGQCLPTMYKALCSIPSNPPLEVAAIFIFSGIG
jgi:hypothetical protein